MRLSIDGTITVTRFLGSSRASTNYLTTTEMKFWIERINGLLDGATRFVMQLGPQMWSQKRTRTVPKWDCFRASRGWTMSVVDANRFMRSIWQNVGSTTWCWIGIPCTPVSVAMLFAKNCMPRQNLQATRWIFSRNFHSGEETFPSESAYRIWNITRRLWRRSMESVSSPRGT